MPCRNPSRFSLRFSRRGKAHEQRPAEHQRTQDLARAGGQALLGSLAPGFAGSAPGHAPADEHRNDHHARRRQVQTGRPPLADSLALKAWPGVQGIRRLDPIRGEHPDPRRSEQSLCRPHRLAVRVRARTAQAAHQARLEGPHHQRRHGRYVQVDRGPRRPVGGGSCRSIWTSNRSSLPASGTLRRTSPSSTATVRC